MDLPALPIGTEELIASIISLVVMVAGPRFLSKLYDAIRLPGGAARVLATYVVSLAVGAAALLGVGAVVGTEVSLEGLMALAGILLAAASAAFQRLKDRGSIAGAP